jgi:hypothetical protein
MHGLLQNCVDTVRRNPLSLGHLGPHAPPCHGQAWPAGVGGNNEPTLFQWAALADARQCTPLVDACLDQLATMGTDDNVRALTRTALTYSHSRQQVEEMGSAPLALLLSLAVGLPQGFQVRRRSSPSTSSTAFTTSFFGGADRAGRAALAGSPLNDPVQVVVSPHRKSCHPSRRCRCDFVPFSLLVLPSFVACARHW